MRLSIFLLALLLSSCAHISDKQSPCEAKYSTFVDMFECTKANISTDSRLSKDSDVKLYMLKGEQLSQQVKDKKITDADAKFEWQNLYNEIGKDDDARTARLLQLRNQTRQKTTNCVPVGNTVSCTTY